MKIFRNGGLTYAVDALCVRGNLRMSTIFSFIAPSRLHQIFMGLHFEYCGINWLMP